MNTNNVLDRQKISQTPVSDSIEKQLIGFEKWVLDNYYKYHAKKNEKHI